MNSIKYYHLILFLIGTITLSITSCSKTEVNGVKETIDQSEDEPTYTIAYDGNGHTSGLIPENNSYETNVAVIISKMGSLEKEGYVFNGWNTSSDGSSKSYVEEESFTVGTSDIVFYAQWLNKIAYHELSVDNILDIMNVDPIDVNSWYYASVDFIEGTLSLDDPTDNSKFQFHYHSNNYTSDDSYGFLRISHKILFKSATNDENEVLALVSGEVIDESLFGEFKTAEISGYFHNWPDLNNVYIPAHITINGNVHYGYIEVSFNDVLGQLTIHTIAYNRVSGEAIFAGDLGN